MLTPIFNQETGAGGTPSEREWQRLYLGNPVATRDTNTILSSLSEDETGTTITVIGGTACDLPTAGLTYFFPLQDKNGNNVDASEFFDTKLFLDVVTPAADESDLYLTIGAFTSLTAGTGVYGGVCYDLATGPDVRAGNSAANTDTGSAATNVKAIVEVTMLGSNMRLASVMSYDSSNVPVTYASRGGALAAGTAPLYVGVTVGRKTNIAGNATVKFKAYMLDFRKSSGFPS